MDSAAREISSFPATVFPPALSTATHALAIVEPKTAPATPSPANNDANRTEKSLRSQSFESMDCSSFLKWAYGASVMRLPHLPAQQSLPADPGVGPCLFIRIVRVGRFPSAHKSVACALVGHRVVRFPRHLHLCDGIGNGGVDARVIPAVKTVNGSLDARHRLSVRWRTVKDERGGQIGTIGRKAKSLTAAPTETTNEKLSIRGGQLQRVVRRGIQIRGHLIRIQVTHRFHRLAFRKVAAAPAIRAHAREKIGSDREVARRSHLVRQVLHPVRHAENLVK